MLLLKICTIILTAQKIIKPKETVLKMLKNKEFNVLNELFII